MVNYMKMRMLLSAVLILILSAISSISPAEEPQKLSEPAVASQGDQPATDHAQHAASAPEAAQTALPKPACLTSDGAIIRMNDVAFMRINYQSQLAFAWRDTGSGVDGTKATSDFYFRRNRLTVSGQAFEGVTYDVKIEQMGPRRIGALDVAKEPVDDFEVLESSVDVELSKALHITAGKTKIPFSREVLEGCFSPLSADRSLFIGTPMQRTRDMGVVLWGNVLDSKVRYMAAIQEGQESGNAPESAERFTGRVHLALLDPEESYGYQGTYLGNKMVLTVGAAGQYESGAVFSDLARKTGEKNYKAWTADVFLEYPMGNGSVTASTAYMKTDFDKAYQGSDPDPGSIGIDGEKKGWYAKAGYFFLGQVGPGHLQPFVRYEDWQFALLNGVYAQKVTWTGVGLNYLIKDQNLRLTIEYGRTDFKDEENTDSVDFTTVTSMLQFGF